MHRQTLLLGALALATFAGLAGLAAATGWEETARQLARLTGLQIGLLLALSLVNYGFRALRWHLFTRALRLPTTLIQDTRHYFGGFSMTVTPARLGELIRIRWLSRETGAAPEVTAPLLLADRAGDLAAMGVLLAVAAALSPLTDTHIALPVAALAFAVALLATRPGLLRRTALLLYRTTGLAPRLFARARRAGRSLAAFSTGPCLLSALALGVIGWLAEGYAFYLLLAWLGADVALTTAVAIFLFATLAGGLTGAPGGLGGAELAMVALLGLEGVPPEVAVPATLVIRVTTLWFAIAIGLLALPIAERASAQPA